MIGRKKLSEIRELLQQTLGSSSEQDPIRWLDQQMTRTPFPSRGESEVLASLQRFLASSKTSEEHQAKLKKG